MAEMTPDQCRTCLIKETEMIYLLADHVVCDKVMSVLDLIKTCTSVQIEVEDDYPQFICLDCIHSAEKAYEFRIQCEKADNSLRFPIEDLQEKDIDCDDIPADHYEVLEPEFQTEMSDNEPEFRNEISETEQEHYLNLLQNKDGNVKCEEVDIGDTTHSCTFCNLIFPSASAVAKHITISHQPNFYQCPHCPVRFITRDLLDKHVVKHDDKPEKVKSSRKKRKVEYICAVCGKKYATLGSLNLHVRKHEKVEKKNTSNPPMVGTIFICHSCDQHFTSADDLQTHMETLHNLKTEKIDQFPCKNCSKLFVNEETLQKHIDREHKKKKPDSEPRQSKVAYKCNICSEKAKSLPEIKDHLSTHDITTKDLFNHLSYQCVECEQDFNTIYEYFTHSSSHGAPKIEPSTGGTRVAKKRPYVCNIQGCDKAFPSPSALRKHSASHESQWPKKCRYCTEILNKWHDYMQHLNKEHEDKKTFICSQCGKKFFKERNLTSHMKTHSGERNFMCDFCGFSFQAQNNLVAHRRIHTGVKPYKCTICPQAFSQHAGLRSHLLNHSGEKKHECPTCHKKFLRIGAMKNHIKTHTGVKDYACHICGARFGASSTRKKHLLTHTGERNHICDFCGKAFSRNSNLTVHRKIHTGETPHVCEVCGKGFIQAHVLRSHMNTHRKRGETDKPRKSPRTKKPVRIQEEEDEEEEEEEVEDITVLVEFDDENE